MNTSGFRIKPLNRHYWRGFIPIKISLKMDIENIEARFVEIEESVNGIRDFVVETMAEFSRRLDKLEESGSASETTEAVQKESEQEPEPFTPPKTLEDLTDEVLRERIRPFVPRNIDPRERLTKIQLGYFYVWCSERDISGKRDDAVNVFRAGVKVGVWDADFVPDGSTSVLDYFQEKIKSMVRKQRRSASAQNMRDMLSKKIARQ